MDHLCYLCLVWYLIVSIPDLCNLTYFVIVIFRLCLLLPCGHLKGRADLLVLVCDVNCEFVTFPFWYPWTGVVLDCIDT